MGLHDALDGFITFREVQYAITKISGHPGVNELSQAIETLFALCQHREWTTDDPLGAGGLLFDACRLCQLIRDEHLREIRLLEEVMQACRNGLMALLDQPLPKAAYATSLGFSRPRFGNRPESIADRRQYRQRKEVGSGADLHCLG